MKCQCNMSSLDHSKGNCPIEAEYKVDRDGVSVTLCRDCILTSDTNKSLIPTEKVIMGKFEIYHLSSAGYRIQFVHDGILQCVEMYDTFDEAKLALIKLITLA